MELARSEELLSHLRHALRAPDLAFSQRPTQLGRGNETSAWAFRLEGAPPGLARAPLVLRVFDPEGRRGQAHREAAVHGALHGLGYPAPRVLAWKVDGRVLGAPFLVMERVQGELAAGGAARLDPGGRVRPPLGALVAGIRGFARVPELMGRTVAQLHGIDEKAFAEHLSAAGIPAEELSLDARLDELEARLEAGALGGLAPAVGWLRRNRPRRPAVVCHGDAQPANIFVRGSEVVGVIDWSHAVVAPGAFDLGATTAAIRTLPLTLPHVVGWTLDRLRPLLIQRFLASYRRSRDVDDRDIEYFEALQCVDQLSRLSENRRLSRRTRDAWGSREGIARLFDHVDGLIGRVLSIRIDEFLPVDGLPPTPVERSGE